jgi:hypothetical protein
MNVKANGLFPRPGIDLLKQPPDMDFRALYHGRIPTELPQQDTTILAKFADHVADIDEEWSR